MPSARTASNPPTRWRIGPWRRTLTPPALVATIPPIVAESRAAKSTPTSHPAVRTASCTVARTAPAPTVTSPASASTGPISESRRSDSTTSPPRGTDPPTRPVLPPCGTTADAGRAAGSQHVGDLVGAGGPNHRERLGREAASPVGLVSGAQRRIGQAVGVTHDLAQAPDEGIGHAMMLAARGDEADDQWCSAASASALVRWTVPGSCSGGAYTVMIRSGTSPVLTKLCRTPARTRTS